MSTAALMSQDVSKAALCCWRRWVGVIWPNFPYNSRLDTSLKVCALIFISFVFFLRCGRWLLCPFRIIPSSMTLTGCSEWGIKQSIYKDRKLKDRFLPVKVRVKKGFAQTPQKIAHKQKSLTSKQSRHGRTTQFIKNLITYLAFWSTHVMIIWEDKLPQWLLY